MSLIKCPECSNKVSDKAIKCINCGYPISEPKEKIVETEPQYNPHGYIQHKSSNKKLFVIIPAALLVLVIIILVVSEKSQEEIDAEYTSQIYGPWDYYTETKSPGPINIKNSNGENEALDFSIIAYGTTTYLPNKTYISGYDLTIKFIRTNNTSHKVIFSFIDNGTWKIHNSKLIEKINKSIYTPVNRESQQFIDLNPDIAKALFETDNEESEIKIIKYETDKFTVKYEFESGIPDKEIVLLKSEISYPEIRTGKLRIKTVNGIWFDYEGRSKNNIPDGYGKAWYDNGDYYEGNFKDGSRHGNGKYIFKNGSYYSGMWGKNKRNGSGTAVFANGDKYIGSFLNDLRDGIGTFTWLNGSKYVGMWKKDKQNGAGKYYNKYGQLTSSGTWINGKFYKNNL